MRKTLFLIITIILASSCSSGKVLQGETHGRKETAKTDWYYYSTGLYYKNRNDFQTAIKYFQDAASCNTMLDQVYYQLAECYYSLLDYDNALKYAELSNKANPQDSRPYILLYNIHLNLHNYEKAAEPLQALLALKPRMVNIHYLLGTLYYTNVKDWDRAAVYFNNILEISLTDAVDDYYIEYASNYLGHICYSKNQTDQSIVHFKRCVEINPENYTVLYILSLILMDQYSIDDAKKYSLVYMDKYPENIKINSVLGRIYYLESNTAAAPYLRMAADSPTVEGTLSRGLYLEMFGKDDESEKILGEFLKKNPGYISPHIALARIALRKDDRSTALSEYFTAGILLYKMQQHSLARENLIKALSIKDSVPEVYYYLARSYEESGNISLAIVNYKKTYELRPEFEILIHIGYLYSSKGDYGEASLYLNRAIFLEPTNSKPFFFLGLMYMKKEDYLAAEKYINKAIELQKDNDTYHYYRAMTLEKQNRIDETIEALKTTLKYNPRHAGAYNFLGYLYADSNSNIDEAIELIKKALDFEPTNGAYLDSLGWAYFRKGQYELALKTLLRAEIELEKDKSPDPVVFDHIGDTYNKMGNKNRAVEYWDKSLKMKGDPKIANKIREVQGGTQ
jgi:tetratricopeptide (TPR) repeat protein